MRLLEEGIRELSEQNIIQTDSVTSLTHLLSGAMNEAVLWIARSDQPDQALKETIHAFEGLLSWLHARID
jgi:hypothetical protein